MSAASPADPAARRVLARRTVAPDPAVLAQGIRDRDRRSLARAISLVEDGDPVGSAVVRALFADTGDAATVGITGPPGVGKSSLVAALVHHVRRTEQARVGVISVDPSSPFTSGALLGDRIRLSEHFLDPEVYIRSMGTRGHLGGVAEATLQTALLLDAFGKREIFLETVGVGQSEVQIAKIADTVLLVLMPGSGDAVQALKAGVMEIPDVIVINKADHPDARALHQHVRQILMLNPARDWSVPIVETQAISGDGIEPLWSAIGEHRAFLAQDGRLAARRQASIDAEIFSLAAARAATQIARRVTDDPRLRELLEAVHRRELDPLTAVERLFDEVFTA